jgi:hypothetical protein
VILSFKAERRSFVMAITFMTKKTVWLFNIVRAVSRGGDYYISTSLLSLWGDAWFLLCIAIASVYNVSVDYFGQRYIVFRKTVIKQRRFIKEARLYAIARTGLGVIALIATAVMYFCIKIPYDISALVMMVVMWIVSYPISISVFTGSSRGLPVPLRKKWVAARKRVRS